MAKVSANGYLVVTLQLLVRNCHSSSTENRNCYICSQKSEMSLFVDVTDNLSNRIKKHLFEVIQNERKKQDRAIRKICDVCSKYLDYDELYYSRMEEAIQEMNRIGVAENPFNILLYAVLYDPLDENEKAIQYLTKFNESSLAAPFNKELTDFITIARYLSLNEHSMLEKAGILLVEQYATEENVAEIISNLYLEEEKEENIPVFLQLLAKAKERFPNSTSVESLTAFLNIKGKNYNQALVSFFAIKERLEEKANHPYYNFNMATTWDSIAGCYLKMGDAEKTFESCETAIKFDEQPGDYKVGAPILHKKAEALILSGRNEEALALVETLLKENNEDEEALRIKEKLTRK
jgi:tetratricopeptide (TPR) repeat protein